MMIMAVALNRFLISSLRNTHLHSPPSHLLPFCLLNLKQSLFLTDAVCHSRSISTSLTQNPQFLSQPPQNSNPENPSSRTRTPLEKQFETWQRQYKHNHLTYLAMIKILINGKIYRQAETPVEEVIAGACDVSVPLYNSIIRFCCGRKFLFNRAFDVYKKMLKSEDCKPTLKTYSLVFNSLVRRFNKLNVSYVYLHAVRSLTKQMKASGVIPDTFVLNMIIKAYAKCLDVDEAIRVFGGMGLYGCESNAYRYGGKEQ
ncbi:Pentatricopeptide repeat [Quillaja saponaria]|uniref:Pentatricopeptide repeat n=1 Tax=Quillaja saponaria TaxID=32244 RepID=A0AAD7PVV2_QUISA|nr:Pentatricopeptide repeat [Quillaja saponaria]KAJ7969195.1 Pentatricopeptide repeat [Quillaja saponaria]